MSPDEQLRALRGTEHWESTGLAPRTLARGAAPARPRRTSALPVVVTALVAVLVVVASVGVIQLTSPRTGDRPAATTWPKAHGATALIRGTAPSTSRTIAGAGTPGGPTAAEIHDLQQLAERVGRMTGQPDGSPSSDARLQSAVQSVRAVFGSAVHDVGGAGPGQSGFFLVLNRTPTDQESQLLRLLPFTIRLRCGPRISRQERDRQQQAAFAAASGVVLDARGGGHGETDTQTFSFWPDRDHPRSARQIADRMAATITRMSGAPPTFSIRVTDRSKTPEGQAALHATGRTRSDTGVRLLVASRPTVTGSAVGVYGNGSGFGLNPQHCVARGDTVVIAPPGSSISADGRSLHIVGDGEYGVVSDSGTSPPDNRSPYGNGGTFIDATTAATYLPRGSTLCGATRFLLV